ncbi:MAG: dihydroneopterin aldolase [Chitinophagales bacterium]|nr:dihydroneopterin aldolase [Chitinophagales bacterium]
MGLIAIEGLQFYGHHGYYKEEKVLGGQYIVDIYIERDTSKAEVSDHLSDTLNYEDVYKLVKTEMEVHSNLIENVARRVLDKIKGAYKVDHIKVRLSKLNPPLKGTVESVYVELED